MAFADAGTHYEIWGAGAAAAEVVQPRVFAIGSLYPVRPGSSLVSSVAK